MQNDLEPTVQVRELKHDRVNFILDNVDMACALFRLQSKVLPANTSPLDSPTLSDAL